jgi:uncharacterized SAM-binding protein YcdF (DUF218 family)
MYAPVKTTGYRRAWMARLLLLATGIVAAAAFLISVVMAQTPVPRPSATAAAQMPGPGAQTRLWTGHQLRCWQHGRLLLDETLAQLPPDGFAPSIRLPGPEGRGGAVTLFSAGTTTCMVKPASDR